MPGRRHDRDRDRARPRHRPSRATLALLAGALLVAGCRAGPEAWRADADREVGAVLADVMGDELEGREERVARPAPAAARPEGAPPAPDAGAPDATGADGAPDAAAPPAREIDLATALALAFEHGRELLTRRESVTLEGLGLTLARYRFGPIFDATLAYLWSNSEAGPADWSLTGGVGVSKILDGGGTLGLATGAGAGRTEGAARGFDTSVDMTFAQPLLRGAGYEPSHEALTSAEREMVYEVRDFELFREDFAIAIARDFFDILSRQARLANLETSFRQARFDRERAEALRQVDRNRDEDVFLARRREVNGENDVLVARTDLQRAIDDFKIRLGLPAHVDVQLVDMEPPFAPVRLDDDSAVEVALANRLDLATTAERLADAERAVRIAADGLRPDLDLTLAAGSAGSGRHFGHAAPDEWSASAGVVLGLPVDRKAERNAYRAALIELDRARRELELQRDGIERDVRNQLRGLEQLETRIRIQTDQVAQERRAVAVTEIRYEAGDADNRDLLEARQGLVDAENSLIDLTADHFIARLRLLRTLGILFIDERGMWSS